MKTIIKDLGMTDLNGKLSEARHYLLVKCSQCEVESTCREDAYNDKVPCRGCQRKATNKLNAEKILESGVKKCSACKETLVLAAFGKHSNKLTGLRSACKKCEKGQNLASRIRYSNRPDIKAAKKVYDDLYRAQPHRKLRNNELSRNWVANNPEKRRAASNKNKAMRKLATLEGDSTKMIAAWLEEQLMLCAYCGTECANAYHIDHIEPLSKGGQHLISNLTIACPSCNTSKNNTPLLLWMAKRA